MPQLGLSFMQHSLNHQINVFYGMSFCLNLLLRQHGLLGFQEWQCAQSKGCFYLEEDGEIVSHKYRLQLPQRSTVYITIRPLPLRQIEGKNVCIPSENFPL